VKPANDAVDGRWPQEQETTTGSNEAKVQKRTTPNNTATNNTTIPAPMATPEQVGREVVSSGGDSPEEHEKEERRRTAQRVLLKQGSCRPAGRLPLPTSPSSRTSGPSSPNSSGLPSPTTREAKAPPVQTYRQFKEQQRLSRQGETNHREAKLSDPGPPSRGSGGYQPKHSLDIKSVQKEAVMSYMDRVGGVPRAGAPPETAPPPPPTTTSPRRPGSSNLPRAPSASSRVAASRSSAAPTQPSLNFTVRREQDRAAVQDTHIHHLRHQIESRLKVSLGEDLPASLTDGVVLCHIANHCSPRSVSSIHVPSPAVPKLSAAKCRRNVDNFLAACRKIGVREDLICSVTDISEPRGSKSNTVRVAVTVTELLRHHVPRPTNNNNNNSVV
jgi:hypothetical protein